MGLLSLTTSFRVGDNWLVIDADGKLVASETNPIKAEKFILEAHGGKNAIFSTSQQKYLCLNPTSQHIEAIQDEVGTSSLFSAMPLPTDPGEKIPCAWLASNAQILKANVNGYVIANSGLPIDRNSTFLVESPAIWATPR